ncbi:MAG: tRNA pseudouridine(38-40) synthase TruA [Bacteroidota bacterium]
MQRYAFEIQYHGGNYAGWQRQPNDISVQEKIEDTLNLLFNTDSISIVGCGRTDAGVHAQSYFFHVDIINERYDIESIHFKVNRMLPFDISVLNVEIVDSEFHARFDARQRTYRYFIHKQKNPFSNGLSLLFTKELDIQKMNQACEFLLGTQDFTSFSKLHTDVKTNICTVNLAKWTKSSENELYFEISADRFLRNMVRAIVGTLIEVGLGKIKVEDVKNIIAKKNRSEAKHSVPAHGLYLWKIKYKNL